MPNVAPCGFLAIAKNGGAIDAGSSPDAEGEGGEKQEHGEQHLPGRNTEGNAEQHGHRRGEGNDGKPYAEVTGGLVEHGGQEENGQQQGDGEGQGELLRVGIVVDKRARRREEGGVEQIAEHEVEDEEQDDEGVVDVGEPLDEVLDAAVNAFAGFVLCGLVLCSLVLSGGFGAFGGYFGTVAVAGGLLEEVGVGELNARHGEGGEQYPQRKLGEAYKADSHHFAHHELEGFHTAHDDFDNAAGLFFHNAAHYLRAEHEYGNEDQHCQDDAEGSFNHKETVAAGFYVLRAQFDVGRGEHGVVIGGEAVDVEKDAVAEYFLQLAVDVALHGHGGGVGAVVEVGVAWEGGFAGGDVDYGVEAVVLFQLTAGVVYASGLVVADVAPGAELPLEESSVVDH